LQIVRHCPISYMSALFLMHRVRFAMKQNTPDTELSGTVECDETYVGGKPRLPNKVTGRKRGRGCGKSPVFAMGGRVRAQVLANVVGNNLKGRDERTHRPNRPHRDRFPQSIHLVSGSRLRDVVASASMPKKPAPKKPKAKTGPKAEVLKIDGNWQDAVRRSFQAKKPAGGWPKAGK
jgi:hypothetical protein